MKFILFLHTLANPANHPDIMKVEIERTIEACLHSTCKKIVQSINLFQPTEEKPFVMVLPTPTPLLQEL